jgi:hypothetical protein
VYVCVCGAQAQGKLERLRKKADTINASTDISEREKASAITKLMRNKEKQVRPPPSSCARVWSPCRASSGLTALSGAG